MVVVEVELLLAGGCFGLFGGMGDVGVDGGGVVGEQFDAVGEQAGVFVGPDGLGGCDVVQVFSGRGEQIVGGPVGGGDRGDEAGPGGVGDDGFGDAGAQEVVQVGGPGGPQVGVAALQGGGRQGAGQPPPQGSSGHFSGERPVFGRGLVEQGGDVGAGAGGAVEMGGQPRPVWVVGEVGVDGARELAPAGGVGAGAGQSGIEAGVDGLLDHGRAVGVLFGPGNPGVGGLDAVGSAEDRDFGQQVAVAVEQGPRPGGGGGGIPGAGGAADVIGEVADEFGALPQVGRPGRVGSDDVGDGGQPVQRSTVCGT